MSDETKMILDMLREGRITAAEAANLLEALGGKKSPGQGAPAPASSPAQLARTAKAEIKEELRKAKQETHEIIRDLKSNIHGGYAEDDYSDDDSQEEVTGVRTELSGLGRLVSGLVSGWAGSSYSFSEEHKGTLPSADVVRVMVRGVNGRIRLGPMSPGQDQWVLYAEKGVRAASESAAEAVAKDLYTVQTTERELIIEAKKVFGQSMSVSFELLLPPGRRYQVDLDSTNGSIEVSKLNIEVAKITTTNGKIRIYADGDDFSLNSTNGRIELHGCVRNVGCRTVNGRIVVECESPVSGLYDLSTVNGSISVRVGRSEGLGTRFSGEARTGSVSASLPRHKVMLDEKRRVGRKLVLEREGSGEMLDVIAKSVVGSITLEEI